MDMLQRFKSIWHIARLVILLVLSTPSSADSVELITNGSFSNGAANWTTQGSDVWIGTNLSNYRTSPGYAALGVSGTGVAKDYADGALYQNITVPDNTSKLTLSFWYYITTQESTTASAFDRLSVTVLKSNGDFLASASELANSNFASGYVQRTFDLTPHSSQRNLRIRFGATADGSKPTVFRIDDVSVVAEVASSQPPLAAPVTLAPGTIELSGQEITSTPTLTWTAVVGATEYQLYLYNFDKGQIIENNIKVKGTSYTSGQLTQEDLYMWSVSACNTECGAYASFRYFKIKGTASSGSVPPIPGLGNGSGARPGLAFQSTTPELILISQSKSYTYNIRVFDFQLNTYAVQANNYVYNDTYVKYTTSALTAGHEYRWEAQACNQDGCSAYSDSRFFHIVNVAGPASITAPPAPTATEPGSSSAPGPRLGDSGVKASLVWTSSSTAKYYVATVSYFDVSKNSYVDETGVTGAVATSYITQELTKIGQYRWHVKACIELTCSDFSSPLYFSVGSSSSNSGDDNQGGENDQDLCEYPILKDGTLLYIPDAVYDNGSTKRPLYAQLQFLRNSDGSITASALSWGFTSSDLLEDCDYATVYQNLEFEIPKFMIGVTEYWAVLKFIGSINNLLTFDVVKYGKVNRDGFRFPLKGTSPYLAKITAVMDHSNPTGCPDDKIQAYTGETGLREFGTSSGYYSTPSQGSGCQGQTLYGFKNESGTRFSINGQYVASVGHGDRVFLFYDGHTGYDYVAGKGTAVYAVADGEIARTDCDTVSCDDGDYGEIEIRHGNGNGYSSHYLHLSRAIRNFNYGDHVEKGEMIGYSGDTGVEGSPHLHLTIKKNGVRVDPYGWEGATGGDPLRINGSDNVCLWEMCQE